MCTLAGRAASIVHSAAAHLEQERPAAEQEPCSIKPKQASAKSRRMHMLQPPLQPAAATLLQLLRAASDREYCTAVCNENYCTAPTCRSMRVCRATISSTVMCAPGGDERVAMNAAMRIWNAERFSEVGAEALRSGASTVVVCSSLLATQFNAMLPALRCAPARPTPRP